MKATKKSLCALVSVAVAFCLLVSGNAGVAGQCKELIPCWQMFPQSNCKTCSSGALFPCSFKRVPALNQDVLATGSPGHTLWEAYEPTICYRLYTCGETAIVCPTDPDEFTCASSGEPYYTAYSYNNYLGYGDQC